MAKDVQLLAVPYVSQLGDGASKYHNDCGAASGCMLLRAYFDNNMTPDQFFIETGHTVDDYLSVVHLMRVLTAHGLDTEWHTGLTLVEVFETLATGRPMIVLFKYGTFREYVGDTHNMTFNGAHFGVLVGFDTRNVYLHDPLWNTSIGAAIPVPHTAWMTTWKSAAQDGNPLCGALVPVDSLDSMPYQSKEIYRVRVTADTGLRVRNAPKVALGTDTGARVAKGSVQRIWSVQDDPDGNVWGAITLSLKKWVALRYQDTAYAEKI